MRKLLNTLYVTTAKSYLSLDGENILILLDDKEKFRMPFANIENIVCFGYMGASPALMGKCADNNIVINFLRPNGEYLARITGKTKGNVILRKIQYAYSQNEEFCFKFSKNIVLAKFFNTRNTLERTIRDNKNSCDITNLSNVSQNIKSSLEKVYKFNDLDSLRGFEGIIAKSYFSVFNDMIIQQKKYFNLKGRTKRPPLDNVNCMLSYLYIILSLEIQSALETVGIDPYVGFMHTIRSGRCSLALDLVEELRSYLVDRLVVTMINLKQMTEKDFYPKEGGGVLMTDDGRKKLLNIWQGQKKEIIEHPFINEKIEKGLIPYVQSQLLARYLRGDLEEYPPFLCK